MGSGFVGKRYTNQVNSEKTGVGRKLGSAAMSSVPNISRPNSDLGKKLGDTAKKNIDNGRSGINSSLAVNVGTGSRFDVLGEETVDEDVV